MKSLLMALILLASVSSYALGVEGTLVVKKPFHLKGKASYSTGYFDTTKTLSFAPGKHQMAFSNFNYYRTSEASFSFVKCDGYCTYGDNGIYFKSKEKNAGDGLTASYARENGQSVNIFVKYGSSERIENQKAEAVSCKVLATCNASGYDCRYKMGEQMANTHDIVKTNTIQIKFTDPKSNEVVGTFSGKTENSEHVEKPYGKCNLFTE